MCCLTIYVEGALKEDRKCLYEMNGIDAKNYLLE